MTRTDQHGTTDLGPARPDVGRYRACYSQSGRPPLRVGPQNAAGKAQVIAWDDARHRLELRLG